VGGGKKPGKEGVWDGLGKRGSKLEEKGREGIQKLIKD